MDRQTAGDVDADLFEPSSLLESAREGAEGDYMVKHAAKDQELILTAEERVNRAVDTIIANNRFATEQLGWLSLVREHLIENLSISEDDLEQIPIFQRIGGRAKARQLFQAKLEFRVLHSLV